MLILLVVSVLSGKLCIRYKLVVEARFQVLDGCQWDVTSEWWQRAAVRLQCKLDVQEKMQEPWANQESWNEPWANQEIKKDPRGHQDPEGHQKTKGFTKSHKKRLIGFSGCWRSFGSWGWVGFLMRCSLCLYLCSDAAACASSQPYDTGPLMGPQFRAFDQPVQPWQRSRSGAGLPCANTSSHLRREGSRSEKFSCIVQSETQRVLDWVVQHFQFTGLQTSALAPWVEHALNEWVFYSVFSFVTWGGGYLLVWLVCLWWDKRRAQQVRQARFDKLRGDLKRWFTVAVRQKLRRKRAKLKHRAARLAAAAAAAARALVVLRLPTGCRKVGLGRARGVAKHKVLRLRGARVGCRRRASRLRLQRLLHSRWAESLDTRLGRSLKRGVTSDVREPEGRNCSLRRRSSRLYAGSLK